MKKIITLLCFLVVFSLQITPIYAAAENSVYNNSLLNELNFDAEWELDF